MLRKLLFLILAILAVGVALFSYSKYYARKDVSEMLDDARLSASVKTALALNRHLKNTEIDVSVADGTVTLAGAVGTAIQKDLAREIALSIKGVATVSDNLSVNKVLSLKVVENERTLGEKLDDLTIEASVKTALMLNENIRSREIRVGSFRGGVVLTGSVDSMAESELAGKIANDVAGVVMVDNRLVLDGGTDKTKKAAAGKANDSVIEEQVRAALMVNRNIDSTEIEVKSSGGTVLLTGLANSGAERELIQKIAEGCCGVEKVDNKIRIKPGPQ